MKIYLVGGAVRDQLLNKPIKERDWVVVGTTEAAMLKLGYKKVGRDFPVFIHPKTHEEYALARTERKVGKGYTQFTCHTSPDVTLEEDLRRRDLTINAIAQTQDGQLIDPYKGVDDLKNKILRHVSPAFAEDPVRILRVARFAAKFGDFTVHPTTQQLMRQIVENNELAALVPERVWQEFERALAENNPEKFFITLHECGALAVLFLPFAKKFSSIQALLQRAIPPGNTIMDTALIRFALIMSCLKQEHLITFCRRYHIPRSYADLAKLILQYQNVHNKILVSLTSTTRIRTRTAKNNLLLSQTILSLLEAIDAFRRPYRLQQFLLVCSIILKDNTTRCLDANDVSDASNANNNNYLMRAYHTTKNIEITPLLDAGIKGEALKEEIRKLRLLKLQQLLSTFD